MDISLLSDNVLFQNWEIIRHSGFWMKALMNFFLSFCLAGAEALVCIDDEEEVVQVKAQQVISITETLALNEDIM